MRMAILNLARLYQLRLRQSLTIPHQNPHRPVRKISVRKILVVGQIYRYTFAVAVSACWTTSVYLNRCKFLLLACCSQEMTLASCRLFSGC